MIANARKLCSVASSSSYECGTSSDTTSSVNANAKTASKKASSRDISPRFRAITAPSCTGPQVPAFR